MCFTCMLITKQMVLSKRLSIPREETNNQALTPLPTYLNSHDRIEEVMNYASNYQYVNNVTKRIVCYLAQNMSKFDVCNVNRG